MWPVFSPTSSASRNVANCFDRPTVNSMAIYSVGCAASFGKSWTKLTATRNMRTATLAGVLVAALRADSTGEHLSEVSRVAFKSGGTWGFTCFEIGQVWMIY